MKKRSLLSLLFASTTVFAAGSSPPLETVDHVDLTRYAGKWFEIARLPQRFEKNCFAVSATYTPMPDGRVAVLNTCRKGALNGPLSEIHGVATVADPQTNAKLKVQFFWPFSGDYWILDLGADYEYAVVGAPNRNYLWILSRAPTMNSGLFASLISKAREKGFDTEQLIMTPRE